MIDEPQANPSLGGRFRRTVTALVRRDIDRARAWPRFGRRRIQTWLGRASVLTIIAGAVGFGMNLWGMQGRICSVPFPQPLVSDTCGSMGLGNKPTRRERLEWNALPPGDCKAVEEFIARHKNSPYLPKAAQLLGLRRQVREPMTSDFLRESPAISYVRQSAHPLASRMAAEVSARRQAEADAAVSLCAPQDPEERLMRVELITFAPQCREIATAGFFCGADYRARCVMHGHRERDWCGPGKPE
jgi:hypothetical protein